MTWIDTLVLTIVGFVGLGIFYKALKEPVDLFIVFMKKVIESILERTRGTGEEYAETITYG